MVPCLELHYIMHVTIIVIMLCETCAPDWLVDQGWLVYAICHGRNYSRRILYSLLVLLVL